MLSIPLQLRPLSKTYKQFLKIANRCLSVKPSLFEDLQKKIVFNSVLFQNEFKNGSYSERQRIYRKIRHARNNLTSHSSDRAICLKYLEEDTKEYETGSSDSSICKMPVEFPFERVKKIKYKEGKMTESEEYEAQDLSWSASHDKMVKHMVNEKNWVPHSPEIANDAIVGKTRNYNLKYGSADSDVPISNVKCGGCGALLHCQDTSIPGFLPKEVFHGLNDHELKTLVCQRCHFLKEYDIALGVDVSPDDYPKILSPIKQKKALVLLMVDLLDLPCSLWPGIIDVVGKHRPIVVVGNKVDLLVQDSSDFHKNIEKSIRDSLLDAGIPSFNVKHVALISAKSGYGIENLITQIHTRWKNQGDIYIVGCTNVGKSTLFNSLIQSDLCKVQAVDVMQRATVSEWPGTTLNLLKFPILRPSYWRLLVRKERMLNSEKEEMEALAFRSEQLKKSQYMKQVSLSGLVGRTFVPDSPLDGMGDPFSLAISSNPRGVTPLGLNENNKAFVDSKWCYDTPGVVHPDQILNILTTPEIVATVPKELIIPRPLHLRPGFSVLIAGLARIDLLSGPDFVWLTVFAANNLPLTIARSEHIEEVYHELLGTEFLQVPMGGSERLEKWPALREKEVQVSGKTRGDAAADLVLSSAGWIAVTLEPAELCRIRAWTPDGRGIHLRPPFLKQPHKLRSQRFLRTPVFKSKITLNSEE